MTNPTTNPTTERRPSQLAAAGGTVAAGALLLTTALLTLFQGISAVANDDLLLVIGPSYVYEFTTSTWGWIHIVIAALMGLVAVGLFLGAMWARIAAIVMASISIIAMFLWLPYYPVWSIVVIAVDIVVIWAVATWDRERI
ncbi:hypothetical protein MDOR_21070 [Mycolicibacterium doricum]|uniref:DUF7144 domain-containing protein n=1 Tax=Mycolicibacterium doricum TaxID=126673 RepID=A0A1X1SXF7_9MYCO|nr:hypothetical protein [Mycolicibacterium doricum]MCV7269401.1 hypothetical protein [Mycolicibacterium doricum]ORV35685.1 hypothetical protein AWC01_18455 [Mycolicibacterium doricum]BBZ07938.1 hypothetical protein MDOR_21070 [Mycolicibacterium doricum]